MAGRTTEAVVKVEMAEGGVDVVTPKQAYDMAAHDQALRIGGRPAENLLGLGEFVDLFRGFLAVGRRRLVLGRLLVTVLGKGRHRRETQQRCAERGSENSHTGRTH